MNELRFAWHRISDLSDHWPDSSGVNDSFTARAGHADELVLFRMFCMPEISMLCVERDLHGEVTSIAVHCFILATPKTQNNNTSSVAAVRLSAQAFCVARSYPVAGRCCYNAI